MRLICGTFGNKSQRNFKVLWLADPTEETLISMQVNKIQSMFKSMKTFNTEEDCERYFHEASVTETIVLIASALLAKNVVYSIHQQCQLVKMFIYNTTEESDNQWISQFSKVKFVELDMLQNRIESFWHRWLRGTSKDFLSAYIFNMEKIAMECSSTDINGTFLSSRLILDILVRVETLPTDKVAFVRTCTRLCKGSNEQREILKDFNINYRDEDSFEWYAKDSMIYRCINRALRVRNIEFLIVSRFFIRDLQNQIKQRRCDQPVDVYRGQLMSTKELSHWKQSIGKYISMNSFLSTSLSKDTALQFIGVTDTNVTKVENNLEYVLFEIHADPNLTDEVSAFANLSDINGLNEKEILFTLGSVFKLNDVRQDSNNQYLSIVSMTFCGNSEEILKPVFDFMKKEVQKDDFGTTNSDNEYLPLDSLGLVLLNNGHFATAERFFRRRLRTLENQPISTDLATCYRYIGDVYRQKNLFKVSRMWYRKALAIYTCVLPNEDALVATTYMCLGHTYSKTTDWRFSTWYQTDFANWWETRFSHRWRKSLVLYNTALEIYKRIYNEERPSFQIAACYLSLGSAYFNSQQYLLAIDNYKEALNIEENLLPSLHPAFAYCYNKLALTYFRMNVRNSAVTHFEKALSTGLQTLPSDHPLIIELYYVLGTIYKNMGDSQRSEEYFNKQFAVLNHPRTSVLTMLDIIEISGSKVHYICPRCRLPVWVYSACRIYKGRRCTRCLRQMFHLQNQARVVPITPSAN